LACADPDAAQNRPPERTGRRLVHSRAIAAGVIARQQAQGNLTRNNVRFIKHGDEIEVESAAMNNLDPNNADLTSLTADVVSAYVTNNAVQQSDLPSVIASVHAALQGLKAPKAPENEKLEPRIPIKKTITADHLISLEDGRKYKTLKRHLAGLGLTPDQYRQKWGLSADYPMVAPNYARQRSELAKSLGLGQLRRRERSAEPTAEAAASEPAESPAPKRRGRARKVAAE
jgi:predicted transcriptional regulator